MNEILNSLIARNELTMIRGRFRRLRRLQQIRGKKSFDSKLEQQLALLSAEIEESAARRKLRTDQVPAVSLDVDLPIADAADRIERALSENQVIVVTGATGSGKSTQLPLMLMRAGLGNEGYIGHTQPRRIAARGIAQRIAQQLNSPLGRFAGFKIRFDDKVETDAYIKLMTDGVLLAETQSDRFLEQYQALIIDEAHERSLNIDFILGYLKKLLPKRPDLKIVITSATIDARRFADFFSESRSEAVGSLATAVEEPPPQPSPHRSGGGRSNTTLRNEQENKRSEEGGGGRSDVRDGNEEAPPAPSPHAEASGGGKGEERHSTFPNAVPVIEVSGRTYPVEIRYAPQVENDFRDDSGEAVIAAVRDVMSEGPGDILVFLPTEFDIRSASKHLRGALVASGDRHTEILPLYARLTTEQQNLVFVPHRARRIVLATNVAESSITVPGIRFVIDTGTARISRYAPRSKVQRLPIEAISRASADQRAGRCGRVGPGICVRLFDEEDFANRAQYTTPEIRRTNLASAILKTKALRLGEIEEFPFLDPPSKEAIRDGYDTLFEIQAIDAERNLTDIGRILSRLPTDPRIGRILLAAEELGCLNEVAIIAAGLEVPDARLRPMDHATSADEMHAQWSDPRSDFLSLLNLYDFYQRLKADLSRNQLVRACQKNFLSTHHLREWADVHRQLQAMIQELGWRFRARRDDYDTIHQALLTGFLSGVALKQERNRYQGAGGLLWQIWPGSSLVEHPPQWVLAAELVETQRRFGRMLAKIQPQWIEPLARHLLVYEYAEPHWSEARQTCMAAERATLYGLQVIEKRNVPYAPIDPVAARREFILGGLVEGKLNPSFPFHQANQALRRQVSTWASKTRDRGLVVDDWSIARFYEERLPKETVDSASLKRCLRERPDLDESLRMTFSELLPAATIPLEDDFPEQIEMGTIRLPLKYRFEPGALEDGISIDVPVSALGQLSQRQLDWLIPGRLIELIGDLIRTLPKPLRRNLVPVPDSARHAAAELKFGQGELLEAVARQLTKITGVPIRAVDFQFDQLPAHQRFNIRAIDAQGKVLAQGRSVADVRRQVAPQAMPDHTPLAGGKWSKSGLTKWDFGDLPTTMNLKVAGVDVPLYPTIQDDGESVSLKVVDSLELAEWQLRIGAARLFQLSNRKAIQSAVDWLPDLEKFRSGVSRWIPADDFKSRLMDLVARMSVEQSQYDLRTQKGFELCLSRASGLIATASQQIGSWVRDVAGELQAVQLGFESLTRATRDALTADIADQLTALFGDEFPAAIPWDWLRELPRYLAGIRVRMEKAPANLARDRQAAEEIARHWSRFESERNQRIPKYPAHAKLVEVRWLIEELRVSLFAQSLGTRVAVSSKRLDKLWQSIE